MCHTVLERKFNDLFENVRFVSVASKLNKWQPVFGGELLRPLNPTVVSGAVDGQIVSGPALFRRLRLDR